MVMMENMKRIHDDDELNLQRTEKIQAKDEKLH
jgi:hypothetical protein